MEAQLAELQAKVIAERQRVKDATIEAIRGMLASGTLTPADLQALLPKAPSRNRTPKRAPKYRNPDTGDTWGGGGAPPKWIKGRNYEDFLIPSV